ncbi:hypothetical protein DPEC_G00364440 [Dallia pectoralis]|nr:hypothetical protein DPEC_G00364440 [Dallia pectoralis]
MVWMLFRTFCCQWGKRQRGLNQRTGYYHNHWDESVEDTNTETRARVVELSELKRNAIDVASDVIVAEALLRRHGNDSSLLMYHDRCSREMHQALDKLPVTSHSEQVKGSYRSPCSRVHYIRDIV